MALSLTAEQKSLMDLFTTRDKYIIPTYQRPYSWEYEECLKLYSDIIDAYNDRKDYFLGNVIISRSKRDANRPQVVDGQQRLTTLWLVFKALSVLLPDIQVLHEVTTVRSWDGNTFEVKLESKIFESDDDDEIRQVAALTREGYEELLAEARTPGGDIRDNAFKSRIITNSLYFYSWYKDYITNYGEQAVINYLQYLLTQVSLLPIELTGNDQKEADDKALVIFETINNRGRDLSDSDIFKAKLFRKGKNKKDQDEFIRQWVEFKNTCELQQMSIDDAFRYYSHVVRGEKGITSAEKSLRDFFIEDSNSPLNHKGYRDVMNDLMRVLEELREIKAESAKETELAAWLQLVYAYSNNYPLYATLAYAYKYGIAANPEQTITFLKSLVRYCYYLGSTTVVKFEVFNIIRQLFIQLPVKSYYQKSISDNYFNQMGRLKNGYALLAHYLQHPTAIQGYCIDRLLTSRDYNNIEDENELMECYLHSEDLGNLVVLDVSKKNYTYPDKRKYYLKTGIEGLKAYFEAHPLLTARDIEDRTDELKKVLITFFRDPQLEEKEESEERTNDQ